jgi:hypothetical protein
MKRSSSAWYLSVVGLLLSSVLHRQAPATPARGLGNRGDSPCPPLRRAEGRRTGGLLMSRAGQSRAAWLDQADREHSHPGRAESAPSGLAGGARRREQLPSRLGGLLTRVNTPLNSVSPERPGDCFGRGFGPGQVAAPMACHGTTNRG